MSNLQEYNDYRDYYNKYYYDDNFSSENEDFYKDPNEFVPRISGTELELGVTILNFNYFPILTSRVNGNKRKYYLFDLIKIWQSNERYKFQ